MTHTEYDGCCLKRTPISNEKEPSILAFLMSPNSSHMNFFRQDFTILYLTSRLANVHIDKGPKSVQIHLQTCNMSRCQDAFRSQARMGGLRDAQARLEDDTTTVREQRERLAGQERAIRRARQELEDDKNALIKKEHRIDAREAELSRTAVRLMPQFQLALSSSGMTCKL